MRAVSVGYSKIENGECLSFYCCVAVVVIVVVAVVVVMVVVCCLDLVFDAADFALDIGEWESEIRALFRGKRNGGGKRDS